MRCHSLYEEYHKAIDIVVWCGANWLRAPDSSSGVSDQSAGSGPGRGPCVLEQDTFKKRKILPTHKAGRPLQGEGYI